MDWFDFIVKLITGGFCAIAFVAGICYLRNVKNDLYLDNLRKQNQEFFDDKNNC